MEELCAHILAASLLHPEAIGQECTFQPKTLPRGSPRTFSRPDMTGASSSVQACHVELNQWVSLLFRGKNHEKTTMGDLIDWLKLIQEPAVHAR